MSESSVLKIHTDGAARSNPGPAAYAYVIACDGRDPIEVAGLLGEKTNNQAEYTALVRALEHALRLGAEHRLIIHSDSELMVKQLNGQYRVKDAGLRPLYEQACALRDRFTHPVRLVHVRREHNSRADQLCNEVLDGVRESSEFLDDIAVPSPRPAAKKSVEERAVLCLKTAAEAWARAGSTAAPRPEDVWKELRVLLEEEGWLRRP